ncbi:MAG: response regulator [Cytophagaceae bacterium]|nr:response regulator [Cytophagaceae bacterium]
MGNKIKILYVDDKIHNLNAFKANFRREYEIFLCQSGKEGLEILKNNVIHIVIADQRMPGMTGVEFLQESETNYPEPVKIVVTAHRNIQAIEEAFKRGLIFRYHEKPWSFEKPKETIEDAYNFYKNNMNI